MEHFLTVDLEDFYHAHYPGFDYKIFAPKKNRIEESTALLLDILDGTGTKGTFFTLGVIGIGFPGLILEIARRGHTIACHGWDHDLLRDIPGENFAPILSKAKKTLEDITGKEVLGFRAPNFSVRHGEWRSFIKTLEECGFKYDSSVYSGRLFYGGMPRMNAFPHKIEGTDLYEFPVSTGRTIGFHFPMGGFYLRVFSAKVFKKNIARIEETKNTALIYIHPKDIDPENPVLPLDPISSWIHNVGTKSCAIKLENLLKGFNFKPIENSQYFQK
jgi:polysaccharide deacetylase family protein (PEP-CTERM system associated)